MRQQSVSDIKGGKYDYNTSRERRPAYYMYSQTQAARSHSNTALSAAWPKEWSERPVSYIQ